MYLFFLDFLLFSAGFAKLDDKNLIEPDFSLGDTEGETVLGYALAAKNLTVSGLGLVLQKFWIL